MGRLADVLALIEWRGQIEVLQTSLSKYPWDYEGPGVTLRAEHIAQALWKYLRHEVSDVEMEVWANSIEHRDDIEYDEAHFERLSEMITELANPLLNEPLSERFAKRLIHELSAL